MFEVGQYQIEWINEDEINVSIYYMGGRRDVATICGGDMETLLSALFIKPELEIDVDAELDVFDEIEKVESC